MVKNNSNPVLVEVSRGDAVESYHRGAMAIVDTHGREVLGIGNTDALIFPRSAIKPLQAIPFVESGAVEQFGLGNREIALSCASHSGEAEHINCVSQWLDKLGLNKDAFECGPHLPKYEPAIIELLASGNQAERIHNNCTGKHSGFLSYCVQNKLDTQGYIERTHPVQQAWIDLVSDFTETDLDQHPQGIDGCGIPVVATPLRAMALGMAKFAKPKNLGETRARTIEIIQQAMAVEPFMVAGSTRYCIEVMRITGQNALVKVGAEGVYCAALPKLGFGIALKIDDGTTRAAETLLGTTLRALQLLANDDLVKRPIKNYAGDLVGHISPAAALSDALNQI